MRNFINFTKRPKIGDLIEENLSIKDTFDCYTVEGVSVYEHHHRYFDCHHTLIEIGAEF